MKEWLWNEPKLLAHSLRVSEKVLKCYTGFLTDALLAYFQGPQERHPDLVLERDSQRRKPAPSERHGLAQLQVPRRVHDRPSHLTLDTTKTSFVDFFFKFPWKQFLPIWKVALNVEFHLRMLLLVLEKLCIGHDCEVMIIYRKHAFKSFLCEELILVQSKFAEMSVSFSV